MTEWGAHTSSDPLCAWLALTSHFKTSDVANKMVVEDLASQVEEDKIPIYDGSKMTVTRVSNI